MKKTLFFLPLLLCLVACGQTLSVPSQYETDTFITKSGKTLKIHAIVHASICIEFDGNMLMVDPVTNLGDRTIDYSNFPKADVIFVTHEHFDHLDKDAIALLSQSKTQLITNRRCANQLGRGIVMANGDRLVLESWLTVEAVPAYNTTEGHLQFHPKNRDNGFILTIDGLRIYIAGDTEDIPEMADIKNIDVAFLPCNQPYTMTVEQLVRAAKTIKPKVLFPYHFGKTKVDDLPALLKDEGVEVRIRHYE
ncbi:MAG: MBL fold metallo-hydrolase [Bacteroidales bacterium]|nr:MBL fold metallo-hydrolase [Bacteroidales bacterium]